MAPGVIGAGFGRTATGSPKRALEIPAHGPCHHMYEVLPHRKRVDMWRGIPGGALRPDRDAIFDGHSATVDWPTANYRRELAAHYPHAKMVLSRRSPESWHAGTDKTILRIMRTETDPAATAYKPGNPVFGATCDDPDHLMAVYRRHVEEVRAAFGPERLLIHEPGAGWVPLCSFLDRAVPDDPCPIHNDGAQFHNRVSTLKAERKAKGAAPVPVWSCRHRHAARPACPR